MTGIILAGGENRRMGTDKAFLDFKGKPLVEHLISVYSRLFDHTIIVTNHPERYSGYDVEVVQDALAARGPLTGIYSGLMRSRDELNFIAACDMPFLNHGLISFMAGAAGEYDAVVPQVGEFLEPLHAVYARRILPVIGSQLQRGEQRIRELFTRINVRYVTEAEIVRFDPRKRSFQNVNTPQEYKEAACSD
jgi:molybdopterin-guanine dinucleotide biosynthesis protein A